MLRHTFLALTVLCWGAADALAQTPGEKMPKAYLVLFSPSDVVPPMEAREQMLRAAAYTEAFFATELKRWKYPPERGAIFARDEAGAIRVFDIKGDKTLADGKYEEGGFHDAAILSAMKQNRIPSHQNVWWVWAYLGPPPARFKEYKGNGSMQKGGWAVCNLDSSTSPIDLKRPMAAGANEEFTLKGCLHEFGHALGLPHAGPHRKDDLGNELMGPRTVLFHREFPREDRVYLSEGMAAILWKHPLFSGTVRDRFLSPKAELRNFQATFDRKQNAWAVRGRVDSDLSAPHTVLVFDETEAHAKEGGRYRKCYAARVKADRSFEVRVDEPTGKNGKLRVAFCFENGTVVGREVMHNLDLDVAFDFPYVVSGQSYRLEAR